MTTVREWANSIGLVLLAVVIALGFLWFNARLTEQAMQSAREAAQFQVFLQQFTVEANYDCSTLAALAKKYDLFLPPPGTCTVSAP